MSEEAQWDQFNRNFKDVLSPHEIQIQIFKRESKKVYRLPHSHTHWDHLIGSKKDTSKKYVCSERTAVQADE